MGARSHARSGSMRKLCIDASAAGIEMFQGVISIVARLADQPQLQHLQQPQQPQQQQHHVVVVAIGCEIVVIMVMWRFHGDDDNGALVAHFTHMLYNTIYLQFAAVHKYYCVHARVNCLWSETNKKQIKHLIWRSRGSRNGQRALDYFT